MPTVGVKAEELFERLGRKYTVPEFEDLCFDFGLELDDVTSEKIQAEKNLGVGKAPKDASDEVIYKLDIPANRYDLLCIEGISRGLRVFLEQDKTRHVQIVEPVKRQQLKITQATQEVRPFCVAAILRDVTINQAAYDSFIDLQDKLHQNICRNRSLVAIGTHDLDTVQGPFVYDAQTPSDISFVPLRAPTIDGVVTPGAIRSDNLLAAYEKDTQLKEYVPIIKNEPKYPVIRDANGVVLSLPPIINSDHSKISLNTKNIFIECTATDMTKAKIVLNMIVCMFTEYCAKPFTVEPVDVIYPDGDVKTFPDLSTRTETLPVELINRRLGINCWGPKIAQLLSKMQLPCEVADDGQHLNITVPPVRPDIIHGCDIWEDVAIAYGYNNIKRTVPTLEGINGRQQPVNELADKVRLSIAQAGFTEALTFALCTKRDGFENMRRVNDGQTAAVVSKPCTQIFQMVRVNLISGLLKTLSENQGKLRIPIRVFEVGDVVLLNKENETGASNHRRVAAVICANSPHFEDIQGLFEHLMRQLGASRTNPTDDPAIRDKGYYLTESNDPSFLGALGAADVYCFGKRIGVFGVVHPEVLQNYGLKLPCGALELDLDCFVTKTTLTFN